MDNDNNKIIIENAPHGKRSNSNTNNNSNLTRRNRLWSTAAVAAIVGLGSYVICDVIDNNTSNAFDKSINSSYLLSKTNDSLALADNANNIIKLGKNVIVTVGKGATIHPGAIIVDSHDIYDQCNKGDNLGLGYSNGSNEIIHKHIADTFVVKHIYQSCDSIDDVVLPVAKPVCDPVKHKPANKSKSASKAYNPIPVNKSKEERIKERVKSIDESYGMSDPKIETKMFPYMYNKQIIKDHCEGAKRGSDYRSNYRSQNK